MNVRTTHRIINGDCRDMSGLADQSVHLIVTSPPYWQLKDYGSDEQIGFNDTYEEYINNLNVVWKECYRVLHDGCRLCINIGDQFARSVYYGRYKVIPIHSEIIRFCETIGFDFMGQIIWQKTTTMNTTGGASIMGSFPYPRNGIAKLDFEYILLFKKQGKAPLPMPWQKQEAQMTTEEWNTYFNGHWYFNGARQDKHLAMFPEELPKRLIKMFSFPGEVVLDPFMGSGTTALVAKKLGRNSVGYEINSSFLPLIKERVAGGDLFDGCNVVTFEQQSPISKEQMMLRRNELPYLFKDVHKTDKKVDVKLLQYGSKIDSSTSRKRQELFSVKEIMSPECVVLNNGLMVRLIGVKTNPQCEEACKNYIRDTVKGKRVFLKYDTEKYDANNNMLVYLYLENKTFINAHILKDKLAWVDSTFDYKYKQKFLAL